MNEDLNKSLLSDNELVYFINRSKKKEEWKTLQMFQKIIHTPYPPKVRKFDVTEFVKEERSVFFKEQEMEGEDFLPKKPSPKADFRISR
jgi:hypothetical protein